SLSWNVIYKNPKNVGYKLYISNSEIFSATPEIELTERFYKFTAPENEVYYWKVVPFAGNVPGPESEVRWFKIDPAVIQPIVIPIYPKNNSTINTTWVELQWDLDYSGAKSKVRYDVYLDNATSYRPGMKQINHNYRQFFIPVELADHQTYYWYVLPSIEAEEGYIVGEFQGKVARFDVDTGYLPPPEPDFKLTLNRTSIRLNKGESATLEVKIENTGNVPLTVDLTYSSEPPDILFINLMFRRITILPGAGEIIELGVTAPPNTEPTLVNVTIRGTADDLGLVYQDSFSVDVNPEGQPEKSDGENKGYELNWLTGLSIFFIITILILISLFLYTTIKRHRVLEHQRREMIYGYVKEHPGEHFRAIQKALSLEVGVLAHHINKLEREEFIKSRQDGQYRRFYPMDAKIDVKLILSQIQERILNWIKQNPGISGSTLATQLGVDRKLITYHVNVLQNAGFIYTEKSGRDKICFSAVG
ncbi:winged helix-turn-helix transcriptional regulator, partial [[Eubacterium] cellulosolvens]